MTHRFQFVWWGWLTWNYGSPKLWGFNRFEDGMGRIYRWSAYLGPFEIRRWK